MAASTDGHVVFEYRDNNFVPNLAIGDSGGNVTPLFQNSSSSSSTTLNSWFSSRPSLSDDGSWLIPNSIGSMASIQGPALDLGDTFAVLGGTKQGKVAEPKGISFNFDKNSTGGVAGADCTGLDDTENMDPRWLLVPNSGTNTVTLKVKKNWQNVVLRSTDQTIATVSPAAPTDKSTLLTISGVKVGIADIEAVDTNNSQSVLAKLRITVKPPLGTQRVTMVDVTDPVNHLSPPAANLPQPSDLQTYLTQVWGKQANIPFSVDGSAQPLSVHWDVVPPPNGNGVMDDYKDSGDISEIQPITDQLDPHSQPAPNHLYAVYINQFGPDKGVVCPPQTKCFLSGLTLVHSPWSFISGTLNSQPIRNITAHELGHALGADDEKIGSAYGDLMWNNWNPAKSPPEPCQVKRRDWKLVNPTPGDDKLAP